MKPSDPIVSPTTLQNAYQQPSCTWPCGAETLKEKASTPPSELELGLFTAAGFASKVVRSISNVCLGLRLQTCSTCWTRWPSPLNPSPAFSRLLDAKGLHTNGPPGSLRAGLLLDRAVLRQPSNLYVAIGRLSSSTGSDCSGSTNRHCLCSRPSASARRTGHSRSSHTPRTDRSAGTCESGGCGSGDCGSA